jgi:hypothetical protein
MVEKGCGFNGAKLRVYRQNIVYTPIGDGDEAGECHVREVVLGTPGDGQYRSYR